MEFLWTKHTSLTPFNSFNSFQLLKKIISVPTGGGILSICTTDTRIWCWRDRRGRTFHATCPSWWTPRALSYEADTNPPLDRWGIRILARTPDPWWNQRCQTMSFQAYSMSHNRTVTTSRMHPPHCTSLSPTMPPYFYPHEVPHGKTQYSPHAAKSMRSMQQATTMHRMPKR